MHIDPRRATRILWLLRQEHRKLRSFAPEYTMVISNIAWGEGGGEILALVLEESQ